MDGWTPLHVATYYDNYGVMSILLEAGANVFALDCDLNYPINHIMNGLYTFLLLAGYQFSLLKINEKFKSQ